MRNFFALSIMLFLTIFFNDTITAVASYTVDCTGTNDETSASVSGECEDGDFSGTDDETGNSVSGDCEFDGDLDATDDETGEHVSGDCEGE